MPKQLTEAEILGNRELVMKLVERFEPVRREQVKAMLSGKFGDEYFMAPASSRLEYHSCFTGGLVHHSLIVLANLRQLVGALAPQKYDQFRIVFCALFHDLGKAGDGTEPAYLDNPEGWQKEKWGKLYEVNPKCMDMPNSERGLYVLHKFGVDVSAEEWLAIRLNDGQYVRENEPFRGKEPELALLLHWADHWAMRQEKQESAA